MQSCVEIDKKTLLIVDDDETHRISLQGLLEDNGYSCVTAENGIEALAILLTKEIDLLLTDNIMPELDGLTLIRYMNELKPTRSIPVIFFTSQFDPKVRVWGQGAKVFATLSKPYDIQDMLKTVRKVFIRL